MIPLLLLLLGCMAHHLQALPMDARVDPSADLRPHDSAQTEWWHVHADLVDTDTGEPLQLFAAFLVQRTELDFVGPIPVRWGVNPFHVAYVAIRAGDRRWVADRASFPDLFAAGFTGVDLDLHHGDWRIAREGDALVLTVGVGREQLDLRLLWTQPTTLPGEGGLVELRPGERHLWAQDERMAVTGTWRDGGRRRQVVGTGFLKHQWGRLYDPNVDGFEWFSMDLPSGPSLSIGWLLQGPVRGAAGSLAWLSQDGGEPLSIPAGELRITPTRFWRSPRSRASWPVAWRIEGPNVALEIEAEAPDQELWVFPVSIYAGAARARGTLYGEEVDQSAFIEQVGRQAPRFRFLYRSREAPDPPRP